MTERHNLSTKGRSRWQFLTLLLWFQTRLITPMVAKFIWGNVENNRMEWRDFGWWEMSNSTGLPGLSKRSRPDSGVVRLANLQDFVKIRINCLYDLETTHSVWLTIPLKKLYSQNVNLLCRQPRFTTKFHLLGNLIITVALFYRVSRSL